MGQKQTVTKLEITEIPLDLIDPNPLQPRKVFDKEGLDELAASIEDWGILQPILVRRADNRFTLVAGTRRVEACRKIKRPAIRAIITEANDDESAEIALVENIQREDLSVIEEARFLSTLAERYNADPRRISKRIHKSVRYIQDRLALLDLSEEIQEMIGRGEINISQAKIIVEINEPEEQKKAAKMASYLRLTANKLMARTQRQSRRIVDKRRQRLVRFATIQKHLIAFFDSLEAVDIGRLNSEQKQTLTRQIDMLIGAITEFKTKLE